MRIGLLTCRAKPKLDEDEKALIDALSKKADVNAVVWNDALREAKGHHPPDAWLIRSTWDYHRSCDLFLETLGELSSLSALFNPFDLVRWNANKTYLRDLEATGISGIPTFWVEDRAAKLETAEMWASSLNESKAIKQTGKATFVVKPAVSANAERTYLLQGIDRALERARELAVEISPSMIQPYLPILQNSGEHSLVFFNGAFSHAIRRVRVVEGTGFSAEESTRGAVRITPTDGEMRMAEKTLSVIRDKYTTPLYARVDLVPANTLSPEPLLCEVELIEPGLFFRQCPEAAETLANAFFETYTSRL